MYDMFAYVSLIYMVHVGKQTIHGWYSMGNPFWETTIMIKNEQCNDIYIDPASHDIDVLGLNSEILK